MLFLLFEAVMVIISHVNFRMDFPISEENIFGYLIEIEWKL